jgi:hypothetical protein
MEQPVRQVLHSVWHDNHCLYPIREATSCLIDRLVARNCRLESMTRKDNKQSLFTLPKVQFTQSLFTAQTSMNSRRICQAGGPAHSRRPLALIVATSGRRPSEDVTAMQHLAAVPRVAHNSFDSLIPPPSDHRNATSRCRATGGT